MISAHVLYITTINPGVDSCVSLQLPPPSSVLYMMYGDLTMLVCDTAGKFEITPLLDNLEGQCTHLNGSTVLDQHDTEEEEGGNGKVYPQPLARITTDALPDIPQ